MEGEQQIYGAITVMVAAVEQYLDEHRKLMDKYGKLICSSDIIESTFGRYKNKGGVKAISADVLKTPLYHTDITLGFVDRALTP
jgi:hypothetical protein